MSIPNASRRRNPLAALYLHLAVVGGFNAVTAQVPPPPQQQLLRETAGRTVPTTVITVAAIVLFLLVLFCVLVNQWRRSSSAGTDAARAGGWEASIRRRGRGLNPAAVAALPIVPYAEVKKHKSGGGGLECAVCLTAFSDGDELRLLPQCSHAFHPDCIDPWLEDHVTCPLCRANLEKTVPLPPPAVSLSSPETKPPQTLEAAVAVRVVESENGDERREETVELERLRAATARMPRSRLTGHSTTTTVAAETAGGDHDHERFTVRLPPHVLEEVLKSRRLRHATSLVIRPGGGASNCEGSSACAVGRGERCHGTRRRWPSLLARTTSWAQSIAEGSSARTGGVGPDAGTRKTPCGHVVCSMVARWPARCKARNLA